MPHPVDARGTAGCCRKRLNNGQTMTSQSWNSWKDVKLSSNVAMTSRSVNECPSEMTADVAAMEEQNTKNNMRQGHLKYRNNLQQEFNQNAKSRDRKDNRQLEQDRRVENVERRQRRMRKALSWTTFFACFPFWLFYCVFRENPDWCENSDELEEELSTDFCTPWFYKGRKSTC